VAVETRNKQLNTALVNVQYTDWFDEEFSKRIDWALYTKRQCSRPTGSVCQNEGVSFGFIYYVRYNSVI